MAIKHTVRKNDKGDVVTVNLTARRAVRLFCLECVGFSPKEVRECQGDRLIEGGSCPLFEYRLGKKRPKIKVILQNCRHCMGQGKGQAMTDIEACPSNRCSLWPYRKGKDPSLAGRTTGGMAKISQKVPDGWQKKAEISTRDWK